ncbi:MAG TPA: DUF3892 domain-containing protein [Verrucomicrobiae bacterium]|nr:DUF3892 domain-containing protein [Verrucomicrobiae bacterium]
MAIVLKVKWVDQADELDPYLRIRHIGGEDGALQWKHTHAQAVQSIERGQFHYYVEKNARALKLEIGLSPSGRKYLKTPEDGAPPKLLLSLPETPPPPFPSKQKA